MAPRLLNPAALFIIIAAFLPLLDLVLPHSFRLSGAMSPIFIFALLGLGLNIVTGFTGLLHLGVSAFMAIGVYTYGIATCEIYPFQLSFWPALALAVVLGAIAGVLLGIPTLRLRGDYLAIVTLAFGEIVQDLLRNLDTITKGTQGINPLPPPTVAGYSLSASNPLPWYYLLLAIVAVVIMLNRNLLFSRIGRGWISVREDELAASCMGIPVIRTKLIAFASCAALCSTAGALWASYLGSTGEPGNYDFQISVIALCITIVGGLGRLDGILVGALVMVGFNSIVLVKLSNFLAAHGLSSNENVFSNPNNWKYMVFGLALIVMMRYRPWGLLPAQTSSGGASR